MKNPKIISPMATGNGAHVVHYMLERNIDNYIVTGYNPLYTLFPFSLRSILPAGEYNIIHTTPDYALFFYQRKLPLVLSFQNYVLDHWVGTYSSLLQRVHYMTDLRLFTRMAIKNSVSLTAVSKFTANIVQKDLQIDRPIQVIYNSVEEEVFTPQRSPKSKSNEIRVFFSGNLTRRKGAQWLHDIAGRLQSNIVIYYTQGLRTRHVLPAHPKLRSIGPVPFEKMPTRYRKMDILLMPTVREGFSLSILEAMACGLPVVASDCSSLPEQIDNGRGGYLCPVGDVDEFAEKLNHLADSPHKRREMGQYNRSKIEQNFTIKRMVNAYKRLFESILV